MLTLLTTAVCAGTLGMLTATAGFRAYDPRHRSLRVLFPASAILLLLFLTVVWLRLQPLVT